MKKNNKTSLKALDRDKYNQLRSNFKKEEKLKLMNKEEFFFVKNITKSQQKFIDMYFKYLEERDELKKEIKKLPNVIQKELLKDKVWQFRGMYAVDCVVLSAIREDYIAIHSSFKEYKGEYLKALSKLRKEIFAFSVELNKTKKKLEAIKENKIDNSSSKTKLR